jgi:hypothetical protein
MNEIIRHWRPTAHSSLPINRNLKLNTLLFADYWVILTNSEDELQHFVYNSQNIAKDFNMEISTEKTKIMAFQGKYPIHSKINMCNKIIEQFVLTHVKKKKM